MIFQATDNTKMIQLVTQMSLMKVLALNVGIRKRCISEL